MNLIIVQNEEDYKKLKLRWEDYGQGLQCGREKLGNHSTIYYYRHQTDSGDLVWEIYNYGTYNHETVGGDLAGLANSREGNFPFFN